MTVSGWPVGTIIRGHSVMRDGDIMTPNNGEPIDFSL
jgi:dihydroorotase